MAKINREKFKVYEGVFDEFTLKTLEILKRKKYFDELGKPIKTGKEGDVYMSFKEEEKRAIKIFRLTSANFKKISGYINRDFRFKTIKGNLRKIILIWAEKEFRNLLLCHKANMNVPFPYKCENNVIIMEYIGGNMLKDTNLDNPQDFFQDLCFQLKLMINEAKLIHGDLSEFNILVKDQKPVIIDLGQAMSIKNEDDFKLFYDLFERDIKNIINYFNKKYHLELEFDNVVKMIRENN
ncbi:MAG: serine protein kinase RIO [Nanoarchaeota archaeon]|nr:serine protein kinase RIO [Nanoarchaeota archaeon]